ncbi:YraN family protein [candidate division WOR-3 bacterium]|nr:YraN family protein [candidate division WOR-3 bacterium]
MSTRERGAAAEKLARAWLAGRGYRVIESNYRSRVGEIDIICKDRDTVVFVEVKSRATADFGSPAQAVDHRKQRKLRRLAEQYLIERRLESSPARFDVLSILAGPAGPRVEHFEGAF